MSIRIAGIQAAVVFKDVAGNLSLVEQEARRAADAGARLAVFPEAFITGYCFSSREEASSVADSIPGRTTDRLTALCQQLNLFLIVGLIERREKSLFNTAVLVGPAGLVGAYRKTHLPCLGLDRFVAQGNDPYTVFEAAGLRIGMLICYDGSFPEATRCLALAGADLVCLPTNWPTGGVSAANHFTNARALENHVYFAAVNRVGREGNFTFIGKSRICAPNGDVLAEAWHDEPAMLIADVDPEIARDKHLVRVPNEHEIDRFRDRRPDLYGPLLSAR